MDLDNKTYARLYHRLMVPTWETRIANVDLKIHTVRIGLNYRFGGYGYGAY